MSAPDLTSFLGRERELEEVMDRLTGGARLVTITGAGGTGKTRLARRIEQQWRTRRGGLSAFADLTDARTDADVCAEVARGLELPLAVGSATEVIERLGIAISTLGQRLLVLDNIEHLLERAQEIIGRWLRLAPDLIVLSTSREPTHLPPEHVYQLHPFAVPPVDGSLDEIASYECVRLFVERGRATKFDFAFDENNRADIVELMRLVDGLALAIELCAARLNVLSPKQLVSMLSQHAIDVLHDRRGRSGRHASLTAALDWSWDLMAPHERLALAQAAVFRGGFTLQAAQMVLEIPDAIQVVDVLQSLVEKSLVVREEDAAGSRFRLPEMVGAYAEGRLSDLERTASAVARHRQYYLQMPVYWAPPSQSEIDAVGRERPNLLAVFHRSMDEGDAVSAVLAMERVLPHFLLYGPRGRLLELVHSALDAMTGLSGERVIEARARAERCKVALEWISGIEEPSRQLELALETGIAELIIRARLDRARWHHFRGESDAVHMELAKIRELLPRVRDPVFEWECQDRLGEELAYTGDLRAGEPLMRDALERAKARRWEFLQYVSLLRIAAVVRTDRPAEAAELRAEAESLYRALGANSVGSSLWSYYRVFTIITEAHGLHEHGDLERARERVRSGTETASACGFTRFEGYGWWTIAEIDIEEGRFESALAPLQRAKTLLEKDARRYTVMATEGLAFAAMGRTEVADSIFDRLLALPELVDRPRDAVLVHAATASLLAALHLARAGQKESALERWARAIPVIERGVPDGIEFDAPRRLFRVSLDRIQAERWLPRPHHVYVDRQGRWIRVSGGDEKSTAAPEHLPRIVQALCRAHRLTPGRRLTPDELFEAGWPGERAIESARGIRVRVAISRLRKAGFGDAIETHDSGYRLSCYTAYSERGLDQR